MNNEHITELIDHLRVHPMWRILNFDVFQNSFVVYVGPYDKDTMTKSWSDYLEDKKSLNDDERTARKVDLNFVLTDDHSRCRGLVCWHNKKYRPGRTHFMFVFADTVKRDSELIGVIAHEATHCMDYIMNECSLDRISGPGPSETAAWIMQFIIRKIFRWFDEIVPPPTPAEEPPSNETGKEVVQKTHEKIKTEDSSTVPRSDPDQECTYLRLHWDDPTVDKLGIALNNSVISLTPDLILKENVEISDNCLYNADAWSEIKAMISSGKLFEEIRHGVNTDQFNVFAFTIENIVDSNIIDINTFKQYNIQPDNAYKIHLEKANPLSENSDALKAVCHIGHNDACPSTTHNVYVVVKLYNVYAGEVRFHPQIARICTGDSYSPTHILSYDENLGVTRLGLTIGASPAEVQDKLGVEYVEIVRDPVPPDEGQPTSEMEPEPQPAGESTGEDTPVSEPVPVDSGHRPRSEKKKKSIHPGAAMESQWIDIANPYRDIDNLMTAINNTDRSRMIWSSCTGQKIPPCLEDPEIMSPWLQSSMAMDAGEIRKRIVAFLAFRSTNSKNVDVRKVGEDLVAFVVKNSPWGSLVSDICKLSDLQEASKRTHENYLITLSPKLHLYTNERMYAAECRCTTAPVLTDALTFFVKLHGNEDKPELFSPILTSIATGIGLSETLRREGDEYVTEELWDKAVNKHEPLTMEEAERMGITSVRILPQLRS